MPRDPKPYLDSLPFGWNMFIPKEVNQSTPRFWDIKTNPSRSMSPRFSVAVTLCWFELHGSGKFTVIPEERSTMFIPRKYARLRRVFSDRKGSCVSAHPPRTVMSFRPSTATKRNIPVLTVDFCTRPPPPKPAS